MRPVPLFEARPTLVTLGDTKAKVKKSVDGWFTKWEFLTMEDDPIIINNKN